MLIFQKSIRNKHSLINSCKSNLSIISKRKHSTPSTKTEVATKDVTSITFLGTKKEIKTDLVFCEKWLQVNDPFIDETDKNNLLFFLNDVVKSYLIEKNYVLSATKSKVWSLLVQKTIENMNKKKDDIAVIKLNDLELIKMEMIKENLFNSKVNKKMEAEKINIIKNSCTLSINQENRINLKNNLKLFAVDIQKNFKWKVTPSEKICYSFLLRLIKFGEVRGDILHSKMSQEEEVELFEFIFLNIGLFLGIESKAKLDFDFNSKKINEKFFVCLTIPDKPIDDKFQVSIRETVFHSGKLQQKWREEIKEDILLNKGKEYLDSRSIFKNNNSVKNHDRVLEALKNLKALNLVWRNQQFDEAVVLKKAEVDKKK
ncbi:hypothetical protein HK099_008372 [Clydaea vesicula]|uniref:Uncharacterized protein n=1 Tax=Clydaea vesicula TaxID=447962 RepID=A0AAD5U692_9FUNG|nr:hypothetical protein HK099_008372 [Clydaea vesicula]